MKAKAELQKISDDMPEYKPDEDVRPVVHTECPKLNHREDQAAMQGGPRTSSSRLARK